MEHKTMRKFKFFFAWNDEQEEAWLHDMALSGWKLITVTFPGFYTFEQVAPANMIYRLDFNSDARNYPAYLGLFEDAGWEHVLAYGSWHYFRMIARPGETPEIYSDNTSKIAKYQRVILLLVALLPLFITAGSDMYRSELLFFQILAGVRLALLLLFIYAILMLIRRVSQLKRLKE
jgi:hypothetical protein